MSGNGGKTPGRRDPREPRKRDGVGSRSLVLRDGAAVRVSRENGGEKLSVVGTGGEVRLELLLTPQGAVLRLPPTGFRIETQGELALRCSRFEVEAEAVCLKVEGDIALKAGGGLSVHAGRDAALSAQAVSLEARRGEVRIAANDDVALTGERVLLNCPTEGEIEERRRAAGSLKELLELPFRNPGDPRRLPPSEPVDEEIP